MTILISFSLALARIKELLQLAPASLPGWGISISLRQVALENFSGRAEPSRPRNWLVKINFICVGHRCSPSLVCNTFLNESDVPPIVPISNLRPRSFRYQLNAGVLHAPATFNMCAHFRTFIVFECADFRIRSAGVKASVWTRAGYGNVPGIPEASVSFVGMPTRLLSPALELLEGPATPLSYSLRL